MYDVPLPTRRRTQTDWGLHPHDNVTVGQGGKVVFRTAVGYHDIAVVPTSEEYDACDVSNAETWVNPTGEVMVNGAGEVEKSEFFYEFTYNADVSLAYFCVERQDFFYSRGIAELMSIYAVAQDFSPPLLLLGSYVLCVCLCAFCTCRPPAPTTSFAPSPKAATAGQDRSSS